MNWISSSSCNSLAAGLHHCLPDLLAGGRLGLTGLHSLLGQLGSGLGVDRLVGHCRGGQGTQLLFHPLHLDSALVRHGPGTVDLPVPHVGGQVDICHLVTNVVI